MIFWTIFFMLGAFVYLLAAIANKSYTKNIILVYIIFIWFIGAFRLNIGTDYTSYEIMYHSNTNPFSFQDGLEPTFSLIAGILNSCGFNSQMLFVVYETIIIYFLYAGARKYFSNPLYILLFMILYTVFPTNGGYWWDLNVMRQAAAISIAFWSSGFFFEKKYFKCLFSFCMAVLFHYSAVVFVILFLWKKRFSVTVVIILLLLGFIGNYTGITSSIAMKMFASIMEMYGVYEGYEVAVFDSIAGTELFSRPAFFLTIWYVSATYYLKKENIPVFIFNGAGIYILLRVYMSFGIEDSIFSTVVHRFETYYLPFFFILLTISMNNFVAKYRYRLKSVLLVTAGIMSFVMLSMYTMYNQDRDVLSKINPKASYGNIDYDFNFDLF